MIVFRKELAQTHDSPARAHLRLKAINEAAHLFNQLAFTFSECHLLIFDIVDFALICFEELCVSFAENIQSTLMFFTVDEIDITINLRLHETLFD